MIIDAAKVFVPSIAAFAIGILITPILTDFLYRHQLWKKKAKDTALDGRPTPIFNKLHAAREVGTPKMGGIVIWASILLTTLLFWVLARLNVAFLTEKLDFVSRNQTWLPLFTLIVGAGIGLLDDIADVRGGGDHIAGGLSLKKRLIVVTLLGLVGGWWFFFKLDVASIIVPFFGEATLGLFFIPTFIAVMLLTYSGGVIDGLDGLAGGVFAIIFAAYGGIAFFQNQIDLAALAAVIVGGLLAFLWFNIPPARFYMSETGSMALSTTLAVFAFLTKAVVVLPIIALPLMLTTGSVVLQLASKRLQGGKKIFLVAPLHHHFEALGWPAYKVTMRYWVISIMFALIGMVIALIG